MALSEHLLPSRKRSSSIDHHHHHLLPPSKLHIFSFLDDLDSSLPQPLDSSPTHRRRLAEIMQSLQRAMETARSSEETPICSPQPPLLPSEIDSGLDEDDAICEILFAGQGLEAVTEGEEGGLATVSEEAQEREVPEEALTLEGPLSGGEGSESLEDDGDEDLRRFLAQLSADSSSELSVSEQWEEDPFCF